MTTSDPVEHPMTTEGLDALRQRVAAIRRAFGVPGSVFGSPPVPCPVCKRPWRGMSAVITGSQAVCCGASRSDLLASLPLADTP